MEEIEITSWQTLDAIKKAAKIVDTVGDLQSGHKQSIFCVIEDDLLELVYIDTESNFLRRYEDKDEFRFAMEKQKEEEGEALYEENHRLDDDFIDEDIDSSFAGDEDSESF
ncbi:MAG: hypothetical protein JXB23_04230 [Candidatus Aminicenantes bacterium]|nr:hypothetical protein [Candidatus Aminicenantes bacterium]